MQPAVPPAHQPGSRARRVRGHSRSPTAIRDTIRDAERWRTQLPHQAGTARLYERTLRLHVHPVIGIRQLGTLRRSDIQGLVAGLIAAGYKPETVENVLRLVRVILYAAIVIHVMPMALRRAL